MRRASCPDPAVLRAENLRATAELLDGPDAAEGAAAFLEKRPPRWTDPA